jgi:hypothetical protein
MSPLRGLSFYFTIILDNIVLHSYGTHPAGGLNETTAKCSPFPAKDKKSFKVRRQSFPETLKVEVLQDVDLRGLLNLNIDFNLEALCIEFNSLVNLSRGVSELGASKVDMEQTIIL